MCRYNLILFYALNQTKASVGSTHALKRDGHVQHTNQKAWLACRVPFPWSTGKAGTLASLPPYCRTRCTRIWRSADFTVMDGWSESDSWRANFFLLFFCSGMRLETIQESPGAAVAPLLSTACRTGWTGTWCYRPSVYGDSCLLRRGYTPLPQAWF
jgi:hypothetical protein